MSLIERLRDKIYGFSVPVAAVSPVYSKDKPDVSGDKDPSESVSDEEFFENIRKVRLSVFPNRVMFVCSGNICRSAYGEYRFRQMCLADHPGTQVISSGTLRITGRQASQEMIAVGAERGLDLEPHRSNGLSKLLVESSDIIFVMAQIHRMEILRISPESEKKVVLLGYWLNKPKYEIDDPIRHSMDFYRRVATEIDEALENWMIFNFH